MSESPEKPAKTEIIVNGLGELIQVDADGKPEYPDSPSFEAKYQYYRALGQYDWRVGNPLRAMIHDELYKLTYVYAWMGRLND